MSFPDNYDEDDSPEERYLYRQVNTSLLAKITADTTGPEILDLADKIAAKYFMEREEPLDLNELVWCLDKIRQWKLDRKSNW